MLRAWMCYSSIPHSSMCIWMWPTEVRWPTSPLAWGQAHSPQPWPVCGGEADSEHLAGPSRWQSAGWTSLCPRPGWCCLSPPPHPGCSPLPRNHTAPSACVSQKSQIWQCCFQMRDPQFDNMWCLGSPHQFYNMFAPVIFLWMIGNLWMKLPAANGCNNTIL